MKEKIVMNKWQGEKEWREWEPGELDLNDWDIGTVYTAEYKVIEKEIDND